MPFGFRSAKDEFQTKIDEIIEGLQGITTFVNDILDFGKTRAKHDANLCDFAKKGSRLTLKTHCWGYRSSIFRTYTVRKRSLAAFRQIAAIRDTEHLRNLNELERVLGIINYLANILSESTKITHQMRQLLQNTPKFIYMGRTTS